MQASRFYTLRTEDDGSILRFITRSLISKGINLMQHQDTPQAKLPITRYWNKDDIIWTLSLYGTAIGAGVLFLPINAGIGGLLPLLIMALLAFPMTYYAHRGLTRFVLSGSQPQGDITEAVKEHFGSGAGKVIVVLYFFAIYPILLMYSVAITNTVESLIIHQLGMAPPPRALLAMLLILAMMLIIRFGQQVILKAMSILVFPFVVSLLAVAVYLIPHWQVPTLKTLLLSDQTSAGGTLMAIWLAIPVLVFSFNHSPIISSFARSNKIRYGENAEKKCSRILACTHILMVLTVMFFVFSCVLSLQPENLAEAKMQNISMLSYLANHFSLPFINYMGPIIAIVAISKSFLGHYLGAAEGFNSLFNINAAGNDKKTIVSWITPLFMFFTAWGVATINPNILSMIETMGGPVIALLLFLMPMYAIYKVPAMQRYRDQLSNIFVTVIGLIALTGICFSLLV
jgi:serine transporter